MITFVMDHEEELLRQHVATDSAEGFLVVHKLVAHFEELSDNVLFKQDIPSCYRVRFEKPDTPTSVIAVASEFANSFDKAGTILRLRILSSHPHRTQTSFHEPNVVFSPEFALLVQKVLKYDRDVSKSNQGVK